MPEPTETPEKRIGWIISGISEIRRILNDGGDQIESTHPIWDEVYDAILIAYREGEEYKLLETLVTCILPSNVSEISSAIGVLQEEKNQIDTLVRRLRPCFSVTPDGRVIQPEKRCGSKRSVAPHNVERLCGTCGHYNYDNGRCEWFFRNREFSRHAYRQKADACDIDQWTSKGGEGDGKENK